MAAAAPLILVNPTLFFQLLDVIETIRYFIYIDVDYPDVVFEFFGIFKDWSIQFIPRFVPKDTNTMDSPKSF
jgi:hypothetical protein